MNEIKEELNEDLKNIIGDIENFEIFLFSNMTFDLYNRVYFLIREYARIDRIYYCQTDTKEFLENVILPEIKNSNLELNNYYNCYTNNINSLLKVIEDTKIKSFSRLVSNGWTGQIFTICQKEKITQITDKVLEYYKKTEENTDHSDVIFWISDELTRYCHISPFGGSSSILDPTYEDFMI